MEQVLQLEGNGVCADCGAKDPKWLSINLGVFLCIHCAGVHRHLGTHISQMRSAMMDVFTPEEIEFLNSMGNKKANQEYEKYLSPDQKIKENSDPETRENFIRAKYETLQFTDQEQAKDFDVHKHSKSGKSAATATTAMVEYTGILFIQLIEAKHLIIADVVSSDPYVVFQVGPQKVKSKVIQSSLNPVWNENLQLCINGLNNTLQCDLYDQDLKNDDFLGHCSVDLKIMEGVKEGEFVDISLPLQKVKKGSIHFKLCYTLISH